MLEQLDNKQKNLSSSRKVLPTFGTFCPVRGRIAQIKVYFAHFQVQGWMAACRAIPAPMRAVNFLYATFPGA